MTGDWARQDIFTGIFDKVIISVLSKEDLRIQAPLCTSVELNWEWRFHFPGSWPQPLVFFCLATIETILSEPVGRARERRSHDLDCCCDVVAVRRCFKVHAEPTLEPAWRSAIGRRRMSEPGQVLCPVHRLSRSKNRHKENGKIEKEEGSHNLSESMRNNTGRVDACMLSCYQWSCHLLFKFST